MAPIQECGLIASMLGLALLAVSAFVADAPNRQVYVGAPDGTITALAMATGTTVWTQPRAGQPLAATVRGLAVLELDEPRGLRVSLRASSDGRRVLQSARIELPGWVPSAGEVLDVGVALEGNALRVSWHIRALHDVTGETLVLGDGTLTPASPRPPLPDQLAVLPMLPVLVGDRATEGPFLAGNEIVALRQQGDALLFERYSQTGTRLGRRLLLRGRVTAVSLAADQLALTLPSTPARTMLVRVPSGLTLATASLPLGSRSIQFVDGQIFYVDGVGQRLVAIAARSGTTQWSYSLPGDNVASP